MTSCFFFEIVELVYKLCLTGFVFLIPQGGNSLLRIIIAILLTIAHLVTITVAQPYKHRSTAFIAVIANVTLTCTQSDTR